MKKNIVILGMITIIMVTVTIFLLVKTLSSGKSEPAASVSVTATSTTAATSGSETEPITSATTENNTSASSEASQDLPGIQTIEAKFLGVQNYGAPEIKKENAEQFRYRFEVDGVEKTYAIDNSLLDAAGNPAYPVQNKLKEGYSFQLSIKDEVILDASEIPSQLPTPYHPVVSGTPGEKTVMNFIKTSLMPVGTALYVFGGGWDWQDTGSAIQARTLGVSDDWVRFFTSQDENYTFRDRNDDKSLRDPKTSYYPFGGYNEYYYAGLDCSGFVGWAIYNTFETEDGRSGYVGSSTKMAKRFAEEYGWGSFTQKASPLLPGDIVSIKGHVWISLGTCEDGSVLIVHSTNGFVSRTGQPGGGVGLGAIGSSKECEAYKLADQYMSKFYPEWYRRYSVSLSNPDKYFTIEGEDAGHFSWNTTSGQGLSDALGAQNMKPSEILKYCFGEK